ncbi:MAG TPA: TetR family transcriptional regulator [Acidimicrobiales bacterium]|nr:TetR family transcriptional regulator [Acidimicrobiales bacterium]
MTGTLAPPGRRERKKAATRQALHVAAQELVAERGLAAVTVEAIAQRADVATRTFFNHFSSKEEAVLGWDPAEADEITADLRAALGEGLGPLDAIEVAVQAATERAAVDSEAFRQRMALVRSEPLVLAASYAQWERLTAAMVEVVEGAVGPGLYASLVVAVAVAAARTARLEWAQNPGVDLRATLHATFTALRAGLAQPAPTRPEHR